MATIAIDTHKIVTQLQERGFTKDQAEALVAVVQEADATSSIDITSSTGMCLSMAAKIRLWCAGTSFTSGQSRRASCTSVPVLIPKLSPGTLERLRPRTPTHS